MSPEYGSGVHSEAHSCGHVLQKHGNSWVRGMRQKTREAAEQPAPWPETRSTTSDFQLVFCFSRHRVDRHPRQTSFKPRTKQTPRIGARDVEVSPTKKSPANAFQPGGPTVTRIGGLVPRLFGRARMGGKGWAVMPRRAFSQRMLRMQHTHGCYMIDCINGSGSPRRPPCLQTSGQTAHKPPNNKCEDPGTVSLDRNFLRWRIRCVAAPWVLILVALLHALM